ncbi:AraC family transcriptional regulator [Xanthomonas campestris]|uniref:AraC family transcriptional regulator n=1 Tax=Xanthomonas campestris TaxID=339 RepID=UPI001E4847AE|nr:AraC family transcriptional regulator [Xanthomonas campestris]MCC5071194.1 AraC family transcriptional regulator [Xanthomonas campestris pv. plantaginis]MEA9605383.1 AraC family transcriptional regulator [Xanthomonas campestris pv. plantaginis]
MHVGYSVPASTELGDWISWRASAREVILADPSSVVRWCEHDYPAAVARWNHHPEYELHLIRTGTGSVLVGDHVGQFQAGHVALIGPNMPHDWISDIAPGEIVRNRDAVLQFDGERLLQSLALFPEMEELAGLLAMASRGIQFSGSTALAAAQGIEAVGRAQGLDRLSRLFALFSVLVRAPESERTLLAGPLFAAPRHTGFDAVVRYVLDNIDCDVRMADAARLAGLSGTSFSRTFKRMAGHTFVDFVRKLRVAQACRLLRQSELPVSSICFSVGFSNLSNFNRQFRAETGVSPSTYRRDAHFGGERKCS